jgi:predicted CXXCH cytochrome family protein
MKMPRRRKLRIGLCLTAVGLALAVTSISAQNGSGKPEEAAASYVGPAACKACHAKMFEPWSTSAHGKALLDDSLAPELKGCEACHGPASVHIGSVSQSKPSIPSKDDPAASSVCGKCHLTGESSKAPKEWQKLSPTAFSRSTHGRKGLSCLSCHTGHADRNPKALIKPAGELCLSCHQSVLEESPGKKAAYTHSPVALGRCLTCHDPHGGSDRRMIADNARRVCEDCHNTTDTKVIQAHFSYPVAGSKCVSCHDPHSHDSKAHLIRTKEHMPFKQRKCEACHTKPNGAEPVGLTKPAKELCFSCHPASVLTPETENAHLPAKEGLCLSCHDPHASNGKELLKTKQAYACFACHTQVEDSSMDAHRHKILEGNLNCSMCHKPHSSPQANLLLKDEMTLCGQCHKHSYSHPMGAREDGSKVTDPSTGGDLLCGSCHDPHGSKFAVLTKADKSRELCVLCHKELR